ncbi:MAG TPA: FAD-dependent oxidoreductase [Jatrophihabitantaceae bacterium]|nr:FAD-dependent oxidoreductase [Jatrophihabitantaceae bacterium]
MVETTSSESSLWLNTAESTAYPTLAGDVTVDVAVVGGGIAGLTTALLLQQDGADVAVIEADRIASGVTGCTTAKVSALQSTVYSTIRKRHDSETARTYAAASLWGVERVAQFVADEAIECDLERRPAYTYAATSGEREAVEDEAEVAAAAQLPVTFVDAPDVPYPAFGAVHLADQLQLHPVRYVQGLAAAFVKAGGTIFESSRVMDVHEGDPCTVQTVAGVVQAAHVVIATHFPILDRGGYFALLKPQRSYCIAARLDSGSPPNGMSISAGEPTRSLRSYGDLLIVGGEGHPVGSEDANPDRFTALEKFARDHWDVAEVTHRWSAQDPQHYDHLPVVGSYRPGSDRLWVATGFQKWGFATATFGARILADRVAGRANDWAETFSPHRVSVRSAHEVAHLGTKFATHLVGDRLRPPAARSADKVTPGSALVLPDGIGKKGVYRDLDGTLHGVSLRCTHMGCLLRFNSAETSWDCPCHGSRFDVDGGVLEGPATAPLESREP